MPAILGTRIPRLLAPQATWQRYLIKNLRVEEVIIGDVNNDKKGDALFLMTGIEPQWWTPGADATQQWTTGK